MELLERYLQAVRTYLPMSQQEDILKELRENLRGQIEDRESALGRALNEDELAEILKKHGHPLLVATRYRQSRQLIGATLFPFYWLVMKIILAIVGVGYAVSVLVLIAQGRPFLNSSSVRRSCSGGCASTRFANWRYSWCSGRWDSLTRFRSNWGRCGTSSIGR